MKFNLRDFVMKGLKSAIGRMEDYQITLNAAGWHEKGVLTSEDLKTISDMVDLKNSMLKK